MWAFHSRSPVQVLLRAGDGDPLMTSGTSVSVPALAWTRLVDVAMKAPQEDSLAKLRGVYMAILLARGSHTCCEL